jgi:hypothetical protein
VKEQGKYGVQHAGHVAALVPWFESFGVDCILEAMLGSVAIESMRC